MPAAAIYKLVERSEWEEAKAEGVYRGSVHDRRDGFIHFSTAAQLHETARKYFAGLVDLVLLSVDVHALEGPSDPNLSPPPGEGGPLCPSSGEGTLRWEPARGGDLFPHLYGDLPIGAVRNAAAVALGDDGIPIIPTDLPA